MKLRRLIFWITYFPMVLFVILLTIFHTLASKTIVVIEKMVSVGEAFEHWCFKDEYDQQL